MSLFRLSDYTQKRENPKKTKLDTASKTSKHKSSQCERMDAERYPVSEHEYRWLCIVCIGRFKAQFNKEKPNFVRASKL